MSGGRSQIGSRFSSVHALGRLRPPENVCGMSCVEDFRLPRYLARPSLEAQSDLSVSATSRLHDELWKDL
jgi:hypothetical protein